MKDLRHDNVNTFVGAAIIQPQIVVVTEYCSKGSLQVGNPNSSISIETDVDISRP